jgi:hypothetical protein
VRIYVPCDAAALAMGADAVARAIEGQIINCLRAQFRICARNGAAM